MEIKEYIILEVPLLNEDNILAKMRFGICWVFLLVKGEGLKRTE